MGPGLNSFLFRKCGGIAFLKGFFGSLEGLLSRAPDGKVDYETAMENYYIAASIGAGADLKNFFTGALLHTKGLVVLVVLFSSTRSHGCCPAR